MKLNIITAILTSICISCAPLDNADPNKLNSRTTPKNLKKQIATPIKKIQQKIQHFDVIPTSILETTIVL
ncbi:complement regulator-acquiring protein [Borreliella americana]|uniref:complement regulator-acquiring protein n=1 Tax=Borreliella americana TaxID=478807 RepID=UPI003B9F4343